MRFYPHKTGKVLLVFLHRKRISPQFEGHSFVDMNLNKRQRGPGDQALIHGEISAYRGSIRLASGFLLGWPLDLRLEASAFNTADQFCRSIADTG